MHGDACNCHSRPSSLQQTVAEMDWDRGIWCPVVNGNLKKVQQMVSERGQEWVHAVDCSGYTALHYAASNGRELIAQYLLEQGADPNARTRSGRTPLHKAAVRRHARLIEVLLAHAADASLSDDDGTLPIHESAGDDATYTILTKAGPPVTTARVRRPAAEAPGCETGCPTHAATSPRDTGTHLNADVESNPSQNHSSGLCVATPDTASNRGPPLFAGAGGAFSLRPAS